MNAKQLIDRLWLLSTVTPDVVVVVDPKKRLDLDNTVNSVEYDIVDGQPLLILR